MAKPRLGPLKPPAGYDRWTEAVIFEMLKGPFPDGAFVRIPQVRNGTGFTTRARTADGLIVSCWPSRGLWFAGVEIKVSPSDWKRELASPAKSHAIQQWCNYWYVACPKGIVPIGEIPPTWGLIECDSRGCKIVKPAPKLKPKAPDLAFICAVLRQATSGMVPAAEVEAQVAKRSEELSKWKHSELKRLQEAVAEFRKVTSINIHDTWHYGDISQAVKLVQRARGTGLKSMAEMLKEQAARMVRSGCEVMTLCDEALGDGNKPVD
jgi:hypothetical protein